MKSSGRWHKKPAGCFALTQPWVTRFLHKLWVGLPPALPSPQPVMMIQEISEKSSWNTQPAGLSWGSSQVFFLYYIKSWFQSWLISWTFTPRLCLQQLIEFRLEYEEYRTWRGSLEGQGKKVIKTCGLKLCNAHMHITLSPQTSPEG